MIKKNVLITGASRGIGRSTALLFADKGFHVFLNCHKSIEELQKVQQEIEQNHPDCSTIITGNVGNPEDVRSIFREMYNHCDSLDVLVNNAGVAHIGLLMDLTDEEWRRIIDTNLSSVFYCCREAVPKMVSKKSGRIINISSMWGSVGASCEAAYSASKSGIHGLTRALAKELAPSGISVNAIACGVIDTVMNAQLDKTERQELAEEIPAGRFCSPEEIAEVIWQTVNTPVYMTGQIIGVDGGYI